MSTRWLRLWLACFVPEKNVDERYRTGLYVGESARLQETATFVHSSRLSEWQLNCTHLGHMDVVAVSRALYPRTNNYFAELQNGVLHENIITTNPALQDSKGLI